MSLMDQGIDITVAKVANNIWMVLVVRIAMVLIATMLPVGGRLMWSILESQGRLESTFAVWQARTDAQIDGIKANLSTLLSARYTPQDAERDLKLRDLQITTLSQRVQDLEHELRKGK